MRRCVLCGRVATGTASLSGLERNTCETCGTDAAENGGWYIEWLPYS